MGTAVSEDVIFLLAGGTGATFGLWRVVAGGLATGSVLRLVGVAVTALVAAVTFDGVRALIDGRNFFDHYSDLGILVLLFLVMVVPLWGLFDDRLLAHVSEFGIAVLGVTAASFVADDVGWAAAAAVGAASVLVTLLVIRHQQNEMVRFAGYGWFLVCTVLLAVLEGGDAIALLTEDVVDVSPVPTFTAFAALVWLLFHAVFAAKVLLIAVACVSDRGRDLATALGTRLIVPSQLSAIAGLAAVGVTAVILCSDVLFDWAPDAMLVAAVIFAFPVIEAAADRAHRTREPQLA